MAVQAIADEARANWHRKRMAPEPSVSQPTGRDSTR